MSIIRDNFCKNLQRALSERKVKQVELAEALGVPPTTVNGWMRGAHLPDIEMVQDICVFLKVPVSKMLGCKDTSTMVFEDLSLIHI